MTMVQENDTQRERKDSTRSRKDSTRSMKDSTRSRRDSTASGRDEREHRDDRDREKRKSRESHHSDSEARDHSDHHRRRSHHSHHHDDGDREKSHSDNEHKGRDSLKINTASAYTPEFLHALANGNSPTKSEFDVLTGADAVRFTKKFVRNQRASGTAIPDELSAVAASAPHASPHAPMHTPSATSHVSLTHDTDPKAIDKKLKRSLQPVVFAFPRSAAGGAGRRVVDFYMSWRGKTVCAFSFLPYSFDLRFWVPSLSRCFWFSPRWVGLCVWLGLWSSLGLRLSSPSPASHCPSSPSPPSFFLVPVLGLGLSIFFSNRLSCFDAMHTQILFIFISFCAFLFLSLALALASSCRLSILPPFQLIHLIHRISVSCVRRPCPCRACARACAFVSDPPHQRIEWMGRCAMCDGDRWTGLPDGRRRARPSPIPLPSHRILVSIAAVVPSYAYVVSHPTHTRTHSVRSRPTCRVVRDRDKRSEAQRAALIHSFHSHSFTHACAALGLGGWALDFGALRVMLRWR
ncbi:hypothetical protein K438DRAFT_87258 [Mycena galopus ATCC 62051]|nr:hypothetical protein K438DRAFT_87258 [Mycena galopus ATCC 62051]